MIDFSSVPMTRQLTLRTVMRTVLDRGPISRAELARLTGLSKQTMSEVFRELEEGGWLEVTGHTKGGVGRSAAMYEVRADRALVFGADVGGTKIQAALADMQGTIVAEAVEPTDPAGGGAVLSQIAGLAVRLAGEAGLGIERVLVGTVGIPGAYNARTRELTMVPNIEGLEGPDFAGRLTAEVGFEMLVGNDVNMGAKGEQWLGEGRNVDSFVFIALGTGIGMGVINDRQIIRGARGAAGEIATLPVGANPYDARTFKSGALESTIGSAGISGHYAGLTGRAGVSVREIMDSVATDPFAAATVDEVGRTLAAAILAVSAVVDPERVILGGSIGARPELLARVAHYLPLCMPAAPVCTISTLGSRASLLGTIATSLDRLRENLFELSGYDPARAAVPAVEAAR